MDSFEQALPAKDYEETIGRLNPSQQIAATSKGKVISTIAGAGTGKTSTMGGRVFHLIVNEGIDPDSILSLSFTNESASEFKSKVEELCGWKGHKTNVGTFHAVFNKYLRIFSSHEFFREKLGYETFFIIDADDQKKIFNEAIKHYLPQEKALIDAFGYKRREFFQELSKLRAKGLNQKLYKKTLLKSNPQFMEAMQQFYTDAMALPVDDVANFARAELSSKPFIRQLFLCKMWGSYTKLCKANHAMDFDDVLCNFFYLIKYNPGVCQKIASKLNHILIDEYQDSNLIQVLIIKELFNANPNLNLFIVGDPRQSIYGFRSSDVKLMLNADKYFGEVQTLELDTNYRSSDQLLSFTNTFAGKMAGQITSGQLGTGVRHPTISGYPIEITAHKNEHDEAQHTLNQINDYISKGVAPKDIYVLYRTRAGVKALEELLTKSSVEFDMIGEIDFWERSEVKDIASYIRVLARPKDVLAWARVLDATKVGVTDLWLKDNYHQNNGEVPPKDLIMSKKNNRNKAKILSLMGNIDSAQKCFNEHAIIMEYTEELYPEATVDQIKHRIDNFPAHRQHFQEWRTHYIAEVCDLIKDCWFDFAQPQWEKVDTKRQEKIDSEIPLDERVSEKVADRKDRVVTVLTNLALRLINGDDLVDIADDMMTRVTIKQESARDCIKLMTGHASKGLEAKVVFMLANENESWFPNAAEINHNACLEPSLDVNCEIAEAQRLFYVMMTRATSNLHMSYANNRMVNGMTLPKNPLTLMTKTVDAFQASNPQANSILSVNKYPQIQAHTHEQPEPLESNSITTRVEHKETFNNSRMPDVNEGDLSQNSLNVMNAMGFR